MERVLQTIVDAYAAYPIVGLLLYLWWSERSERRLVQEKYDLLVQRVEKGLADATQAIQSSVTSQQAMQSLMSTLKDLLIARGRFSIDTEHTRE